MRALIWTAPFLCFTACLDLNALQAGLPPPAVPDNGTMLADAADASLRDAGPAVDASQLASGCRDGNGAHLGDDVWTCPGSWSAGGPDQRCASSHAACTSGFRTIPDCQAVRGGIFIGRRFWSQDTPIPPFNNVTSTLTWGPDPANARYRALFYCGPTSSPDAYISPFANTFFQQIVLCDRMPSSKAFTCPWVTGADTDFDAVTNKNPDNGVLCCRR